MLDTDVIEWPYVAITTTEDGARHRTNFAMAGVAMQYVREARLIGGKNVRLYRIFSEEITLR